MKPLAIAALLLAANPAFAWGPNITLLILEYPTDTGTVSSQGCTTTEAQSEKCE